MSDLTGNIVERYEYDPYGKATIYNQDYQELPSSAIDNPYFFTGRRFDTETGLYHYRARTYDPETGRFLQRDPLAHKFPRISSYAAFNNNPIFYHDPDGRENIPALIWAAENMANKEIPFGIWYGGNGGWRFQPNVVPTETVCYESCWVSYMNSADESTLKNFKKTGFSTKSGGFFGRSRAPGGMDWFIEGDGTYRQFETKINKGELGDIVFMGKAGNMDGHAVLLAGDVVEGTIKTNSKIIETMSFYALSTNSTTDPSNYGGRTFTFQKKDNKWLLDGNGHEFNGFGQMRLYSIIYMI